MSSEMIVYGATLGMALTAFAQIRSLFPQRHLVAVRHD
jgi:hypothetical protein